MGTHGGKRLGAGKKKGSKTAKTIKKEEAEKIFFQEVLKEFLPLIKAKLELAKGLMVEKNNGDGAMVVFQREPDSRSLEWLIERVLGKLKETHELPQLEELTKAMQQLLTKK